MTIEKRKIDHIRIIAEEDVSHDHNYWNDIEIVQKSMPEIDYDDIELSIDLLGKKLSMPIIISSMTGGHPDTKKINENLAIAAAERKIGMGVGSERAAIDNREVADTYSIISEYNVPLRIANIGAPQLINQKRNALSDEDIKYAVELVRADALAIHFNFVQEMAQPEGDRNSMGIMERLSLITKKYKIIAKETGAGFSRMDAMNFTKAGVAAIDTGGRSGTSFSAVEYHRGLESNNFQKARVGESFWNWGIPSPVSVMMCRGDLPVIASGGIRNGLDVFKGLMLGASAAGLASSFLKAGMESSQEVLRLIDAIEAELRSAMFLTSSRTVNDIRKVRSVYTGRLLNWIQQI